MNLLSIKIVCFSQQSEVEKDAIEVNYRTKIVALPALFYKPETRFGIGAGSLISLKTKKSDTILRPSQIRIGAAYTQESQIQTQLYFDIWLKSNEYVLYGEIGYYDFFYYFWGIGGEERVQESFNVSFPEIRFEGYKAFRENLFFGLKYTYDTYNITRTDDGGRLSDSNYYLGVDGGTISGTGFAAKYDSRDDNFFPTDGYQINASVERFHSIIGSDFKYTLTTLSSTRYFPLPKGGVLATNVFGRFAEGDVPFFHLSAIGGSKRLRGYYEGFHRDKMMLGWQAEYRSPLFWRLRFVAFAGNAVVAPNIDAFLMRRMRTTAGFGFRFLADRKRNIYLRMDFGFSKESNGAYFTIGEAF